MTRRRNRQGRHLSGDNSEVVTCRNLPDLQKTHTNKLNSKTVAIRSRTLHRLEALCLCQTTGTTENEAINTQAFNKISLWILCEAKRLTIFSTISIWTHRKQHTVKEVCNGNYIIDNIFINWISKTKSIWFARLKYERLTCCVKQAQGVGLASNHYSYSIVIKHLKHRTKLMISCSSTVQRCGSHGRKKLLQNKGHIN